ncbi:hypothetical protein ACOSQ2_022301 [Xanthoceras sorbifolium]
MRYASSLRQEKQKGHWKSQCPKLGNRAPQSQQQKHQFKPPQSVNQSQPRPYRPPQFNIAVVVPSPDSLGFGSSSSTPTLASLSEQLQKLIAAQSHAMSVSSPIGQSPPSSSGDDPVQLPYKYEGDRKFPIRFNMHCRVSE